MTIHIHEDRPEPQGLAVLGWTLSLLITTMALLAAALPAQAASQSGRLTVTVEVEREAQTRNGSDHSRHKSTSYVQIATTLQSDGTLLNYNPADPAELTRQMAKANQVQQRVAQVQLQQQQLQAQRGGAQRAPAQPSQADMMARVQQMQALCGSNQDCLAREAMKFSAANSGLNAGGQQQLMAYGAAYRDCEARLPEGPKRRACIADARRAAGGTPDASDQDDEPPARYLQFAGGLNGADCQVQTQVKLSERVEGATADVQGMVPFVTTRQIDDRPAAPLLCAGQQLVFDTQAGVVWNQGSIAVAEARGVRHSTRGGRSERVEERMDVGWYEAAPWIGEQLRRFPTQGEVRQVIPVAGGSGQVKVKLSWRFEPR